MHVLIIAIIILIISCGRREPTTPPPPPPDINAKLQEAWSLYEKKDYTNAIAKFKDILTQQEHYDAYNGLGWCYSALGQEDNAKDNFERAKSINKETSVLVGLGGIYFVKGKRKEALDNLKEACLKIEGDENIWVFKHNQNVTECDVLVMVGLLYYLEGDITNAKNYLHKTEDALQKHPDPQASALKEKLKKYLAS